MRSRHRQVGAFIIALALLVAACGADDADDVEALDPTEDDAGQAPEDDPEAEPEDAFYEGATIEMIIPFSAGGGTDVNARFLAEHFQNYLAGSPTIQPMNVEGGGGTIGANQFELQTERDGMTVFVSASSNLINEQLGAAEVRYDTSNWVPVMGVPHGGVVYTRSDVGLEDDYSNALDIEFVTAMRAAGGVDILFLLAYEVLGLDVQPVFGYGSAGDTRVALEQGETNFDWQTTAAYQANVEPLIDEGTAVPFFAAGQRQGDSVVRHEAHPDVPTVAEVHEEIHGEPPSGEMWDAYLAMNSVVFTSQRIVWFHEEDPPEAVEAWQDAAQQMVDDQEFVEAAEEALGPYTILVGDDLEEIRPDLRIPENLVDTIKTFMVEEYDAVFE